MSTTRFKILGWTMLSLVVIALLTLIDQALLFSRGRSQNHFLYCRIWKSSKACTLRIFKAHPRHGFLLDPQMIETYARMEWSPEIETHTDYKLNESGFRLSLPRSGRARAKVRVNVFGDSFTFGAFLREEENLVSRLNSLFSGCEFRNYGVPGFNFIQMIGLSRDSELVAESDLDLFLFISDDILERLTHRPLPANRFGSAHTPFDLSQELGLDFSVRSPAYFLAENSYFFQKLEQAIHRRFWDSVDRDLLVERLLSKLQSGGKPTLYFHLPVPGDYIEDGEGNWRLNQPHRLREVSLGARVLKGADIFREFEALFFKQDGHPNPSGAEWIAAKLRDRLQDICGPGIGVGRFSGAGSGLLLKQRVRR